MTPREITGVGTVRKILSTAIKLFLSKIISRDIIGRFRFRYLCIWMKWRSWLGYEVSERVVEYPWVLRNLNCRRNDRILDVGCRWSLLAYELAARGYDVYGIDIGPYDDIPSNMKFYQADIRESPFPDGFFDCIIAVSTLEHVGLGVYGEPIYSDGDFVAMKELNRILKKDGRMLVTLPFARNHLITYPHRLYDKKRLISLLRHMLVEKEDHYIRFGKGKWVKAPEEKVELIPPSTRRANAIVCLTLRKK